jgi:hypothetical protein
MRGSTYAEPCECRQEWYNFVCYETIEFAPLGRHSPWRRGVVVRNFRKGSERSDDQRRAVHALKER